MLKKFNISYIASILMLLLMGMIYLRTMRQRGAEIAAWSLPATEWAASLQGQWQAVDETGEKEILRFWSLPDSLVDLQAPTLLAVQLENSRHKDRVWQGVLAVNDFEEGQILVELYRRRTGLADGAGLERLDGCEVLLRGDSSAWSGGTVGDFCYAVVADSGFARLHIFGGADTLVIQSEIVRESDEFSAGAWIRRFQKGRS